MRTERGVGNWQQLPVTNGETLRRSDTAMKAPRHDLPRADLDRLRQACRRSRIDPASSLFSRNGPVQTVNREAVLLAGGGRALLMQIAHPLVAAGVARHSNFESEPLGRLWRTLDLTLTIVFGNAGAALAAVEQIERRHTPVHGTLSSHAGRFEKGAKYDANDLELLHWVHATLIDSAMTTFERFVRPFRTGEREAFYEESKTTARLFGVPDELIPDALADFEDYMAAIMASDVLAFGDDGRRVAASIMDPPLPVGLRQIATSGRILTEGMIPQPLRAKLDYRWSASRQRKLERAQSFARNVLPLLPARLRYFPHYLKNRIEE